MNIVLQCFKMHVYSVIAMCILTRFREVLIHLFADRGALGDSSSNSLSWKDSSNMAKIGATVLLHHPWLISLTFLVLWYFYVAMENHSFCFLTGKSLELSNAQMGHFPLLYLTTRGHDMRCFSGPHFWKNQHESTIPDPASELLNHRISSYTLEKTKNDLFEEPGCHFLKTPGQLQASPANDAQKQPSSRSPWMILP